MVKEVAHLTMVLVLDEDHMHYSDTFGNIFESGALCKKQFPKGSDGIKTKKGGPAQAIMCHFCLHTCLNDDYAYRHLAAIHLNIQWGCGTCYGYVSGYLLKDKGACSVPPEEELQGVVPLVMQEEWQWAV